MITAIEAMGRKRVGLPVGPSVSMTVIFPLVHFSRKHAHRNSHQHANRNQATGERLSHANFAYGQSSQGMASSIRAIPRDDSFIRKSNGQFLLRDFEKNTILEAMVPTANASKGISPCGTLFHVSISKRRLPRGTSFQSAKKLPQKSERRGGRVKA